MKSNELGEYRSRTGHLLLNAVLPIRQQARFFSCKIRLKHAKVKF
nr:MAG TPA: hypothetical protein [Caudoviricetes sp.]DAX72736.1 MAG TPA: hypothetical protein [Caudoviricetes sp.]